MHIFKLQGIQDSESVITYADTIQSDFMNMPGKRYLVKAGIYHGCIYK